MMCTQVAILMENIGLAAMLCAATLRRGVHSDNTCTVCSVYTTDTVQYTLYTILAYYHIILFYKGYAIRQCNRV